MKITKGDKMNKNEIQNTIDNTRVFGEGNLKVVKIPPKNKLISVVMSYYNRKKHLINTLNSIIKSAYSNFEVIVIDDASDKEHRIEDLQEIFNFLKIIRIEKEDKKHVNPCVPINIGLNNSSGDIIIIQNPECLHYNDVFSHVINNIEKNKYLVYTTINKDVVDIVAEFNWGKNNITDLLKINKNTNVNNEWYCHKNYRPAAYNFCAAITREDLVELNGFDERYAFGIERDDVEFLTRIKRKKMDIIIVDDIIVIHQTHPKFYYGNKKLTELRIKNHQLFAQTTAKETTIRVNPDKDIILL